MQRMYEFYFTMVVNIQGVNLSFLMNMLLAILIQYVQ